MLYRNEYFESSDLALIGALCSFGAVIEGVDSDKQRRPTFYIKREEFTEKLTQAFYARELKVEPLRYYNALRDITSRFNVPVID